MNDEICFKLRTIMEKEDYRKFLYIATLKKDKRSLVFMLILSFIGALLILQTGIGFSIKGLIALWVIMFCIVFTVVCFKIELRYRQRVKTDNTGTFGSITDIDFYEDYLTMETNIAEGKSKLEYGKFYSLVECRDYFIFYYNINMATLLRKKDMKDTNVDEFRRFITSKFEGKNKKI